MCRNVLLWPLLLLRCCAATLLLRRRYLDLQDHKQFLQEYKAEAEKVS